MLYFCAYELYLKVMLKKIAFLITVTAIFISVNTGAINKMTVGTDVNFTDVGEQYGWAK
jgi:hypothetical protein